MQGQSRNGPKHTAIGQHKRADRRCRLRPARPAWSSL